MQTRKSAADKKGMTLVEVSVAFVILAIVVAISGAILLASGNFVAHNALTSIDKQVGDAVLKHVKNELTYAIDVEIADFDDIKYTYAIIADGSTIQRRDENSTASDVFSEEFYSGRKIKLSISSQNDCILNVEVQVYRDEELHYSTKTAIRLLNLELLGEAIIGGTSGENVFICYNR